MSTSAPNIQTDKPKLKKTDSDELHRREAGRGITRPFLLIFSLILIMVVVVMLLPKRAQLSIVSDWMYLWLVLCPIVLCLLPLQIGLIAGVAAMHKFYKGSKNPLESLQDKYIGVLQRTHQFLDKTSQRAIDAQVKITPLLDMMETFDKTAGEPEQEEETDGNSKT